MAQSTSEVMQIYHLLHEVELKASIPTRLWSDNEVALHNISNPCFMSENILDQLPFYSWKDST